MTTADDRARWGRVKDIFDAALAHPPDRRDAFLRDASGGDDALLADVQSLLAADAAAGSFAERPAQPVVAVDASARPAFAAGTELGPYRILGAIGAGGMGEVYRALDTQLQREVAIKVLASTHAGDAARTDRLQQEARVLAALQHPNIATIYGLVRTEGSVAIVMELVDGPTLAARLAGGPLPLDEALEIARQIADALEAAHEQGFVHCDLKPANVTLAPGGRVKVLDFGLARLTRRAETNTPGDVEGFAGLAGTPAYMSPEMLRGEPVDARADVWAFGCLVHEMLTGRAPFTRPSLPDTLSAVLDAEPDWAGLPDAVPPPIRRMLRRCLVRDPRRRLRHIADARLEIEEALQTPARDAARIQGPAENRTWVPAAAALVLAGMVVAALLALGTGGAGPREPRVVEITTPRTPEPWSFALSPDGRALAFVAEQDGQPVLWVRRLSAPRARALSGTEGARRPFWSPDGRSIGFFVAGEIRRIDAAGGSARRVTAAVGAISAAWGPDGTILFSTTSSPALYRVPAAGGDAQTVTEPAAASTGHRHPQFLPGGRQFLFFAGGPDAVRGLFLGRLDSSEVTRLVPADGAGAYGAPGWLLFPREGTLWAQSIDPARGRVVGEPIAVADGVAYEPVEGTAAIAVSDTGVVAYRSGRPPVTQFGWFDRDGRSLGVLGLPEQTGLSDPRLSPDGRRLAVERSIQNETDLWVLDGPHRLRVTRASDGAATRLPVWSPTGDRLAYQSIRSGAPAIAARSATGDGPERVLHASAEPKVPTDWSPDGRFLVYYVPTTRRGTDIWILPLEGGGPRPFLQTDANELWGQISPDGRWMAYQSNETGRYEVYVRPFPSGAGPIPISSAGGVYPRWSRDGRELYFVAPDATLMAAAVRPTPRGLDAAPPSPLFRTHRLGGGSNVIGRGPQYDVSPDGRFLINVDTQAASSPITLLLDWTPAATGAAREDRGRSAPP